MIMADPLLVNNLDTLLTACRKEPNIAALQRGPFDLNLSSIYSLIDADMQAVDAVVRAKLHSDVPLVCQIAEYIVASGGKRMRPALLLLCAGACGYRGEQQHVLAAVVEFIHTATLLHDDVVDESSLRRGRETANAQFGNAASVLVGDFLYSRAFQMMVGVGDMRVMEVLADATNVIAEGEVLQLMNCHNADVEVDAYLKVVRYKTAKLFEASARLGAILGGAEPDAEEGVAAYGMHLGTAFQIVDDVLDYSGEESAIGKHLGDDLAEGKPTLPLIHVMKHGNVQQSAVVRDALEQGGLERLPEVIQAVQDTGALEAAMIVAREEIRIAGGVLKALPDTQYRKALIELLDFAVARRY